MEIKLENMRDDLWPCPDGWTVVGRVGRQSLAYDPERRPFPLSDVFKVDRRAVTPSRILKKGLHPRVLRALGRLAEDFDGEAASRGYLLLALARYVDRYHWPRDSLGGSREDVEREVDRCMDLLINARSRGPSFPSRRTEADED